MRKRPGLTKLERLRNPKDFRHVYHQKTCISCPTFNLFFVENGLDYDRLGVTVTKKVSKRSVQRNRLKRVFREAFRRNKRCAPRGLDIVINAKRRACEVRGGALIAHYEKLICRLERKPSARRKTT